MKIFPLLFLRLAAPVAAIWVRWHENRLLTRGRPLSLLELQDAREMGVRFPEKIRVMQVGSIPVLNGWTIKFLSGFFPAISSGTVGLSLRYGIYVRAPFGNSRRLLAHECVHTAQYERAGSISAFLQAYFNECIRIGYPDAPMEQEAINLSAALVGNDRTG